MAQPLQKYNFFIPAIALCSLSYAQQLTFAYEVRNHDNSFPEIKFFI